MEGLGLGDPLQKAISLPLFLLSLRGHWFHQWEVGGGIIWGWEPHKL